MHRLAQILVVLAALVIAAWSYFVGSIAVDLALDYPRRLAGESPEYPAQGTFAYYWNCARAVVRNLTLYLPWFVPLWGTTALAVARCFKPSLNGRCTSRRVGLASILLTLTLYTAAWAVHGMALTRDPGFSLPVLPAVILLCFPRWWPHALFVTSAWIAFLIFSVVKMETWSLGSFHDVAGIACVVSVFYIHVSPVFRHAQTENQNAAPLGCGTQSPERVGPEV